jgi:AhpD family alkylhydroperoxidase
MATDHKAYAKEIDARAAALYKAAPETMRAFNGLKLAAGRDGALDALTKELMALSIAVATRCEACINYHVRESIRKGASREQLAETVSVAIEMGGGPATVYAALALDAFDRLKGGNAQDSL